MRKCKWCGKIIKKGTRKPFKYCPPPATCGEKWRKAYKGGESILQSAKEVKDV